MLQTGLLVRAEGVEPSSQAWEARIIPIYYARFLNQLTKHSICGLVYLNDPRYFHELRQNAQHKNQVILRCQMFLLSKAGRVRRAFHESWGNRGY